MDRTNEDVSESLKPPMRPLSYLATLAFFVSLILIILSIFASLSNFAASDGPWPADASGAFKQLIGWTLPEATQVLTSEHTHGGLTNDGDLTVIVQIPPEELSTLIGNDSNTWHNCPVTPEIARGAWSLPNHSGLIYSARKTSETDKDWHRGHVVIANPDTGAVWLYEWKM